MPVRTRSQHNQQSTSIKDRLRPRIKKMSDAHAKADTEDNEIIKPPAADDGGLSDLLGKLAIETPETKAPEDLKPKELKGNEKRKASCKAVGGDKKRSGHSKESLFNEQFGIAETEITYKAEADCTISADNENGAKLIATLKEKFGDCDGFGVSIKSGENLQFVLGKLPELADKSKEEQLEAVSQKAIWDKYLAKSESSMPAYWLVYRVTNKKRWVFFKMSDVVNYIVTNCRWRVRDSGRLKGDFKDSSKKGSRQYLTYEYRPTHKSHFLGANGGKGKEFIKHLVENITYLRVDDPGCETNSLSTFGSKPERKVTKKETDKD